MRRLSMALMLVLILTSGIAAHEGSIGLYYSQAALDCDFTLVPFSPINVYIMYFRSDGGPDGITACEFKLGSNPPGVLSLSFTPSPEVAATTGSIITGLSAAFENCTGTSQSYVYVGYVETMLTEFGVPSLQIQVLASDDLNIPPYTPRATDCGDLGNRQICGLLGGWFTSPDGTCSVANNESSWGAIKDMYR